MYGLNAAALVFFGCINVMAYQLCKRPESRRRKIVLTLCAILLFGNLLRRRLIGHTSQEKRPENNYHRRCGQPLAGPDERMSRTASEQKNDPDMVPLSETISGSFFLWCR